MVGEIVALAAALVGGLEPWNLIFPYFSIYWESSFQHIPTDFHSIIFQRGRVDITKQMIFGGLSSSVVDEVMA